MDVHKHTRSRVFNVSTFRCCIMFLVLFSLVRPLKHGF